MIDSPLGRAAAEVVRRLRKAGHEAYFAGGCVRDHLLGLAPHDIDVTTAAAPEAVMALFPRNTPVGVAFGVVRVRHGGFELEVATFRSDGAYLDGRHPTTVAWSTAAEDVARRDFTVNGLLYDPEARIVIDHVGGQADLAARVLRCIGDPAARFGEDRLRRLRAVRFAVRFELTVHPDTWAALTAGAGDLAGVSPERIRDELLKMLVGPRPDQAVRMLHASGLLASCLPEVAALQGVRQPPDKHPEGDVLEHTIRVVAALPAPAPDAAPWAAETLALAALLHDVGKPATFTETDRIRFLGHEAVGGDLAVAILERLRLPRAVIDDVAHLVRGHMGPLQARQMRRSTLLRFLRQPLIEPLLALHRADAVAGAGDLSGYDLCVAARAEIPEEQLRPPRLLDGNDLIALGVPRGPRLGALLAALEDAQLEGRVGDRAAAESLVRAALASPAGEEPAR